MRKLMWIGCLLACFTFIWCQGQKKSDSILDRQCLPQIESFFDGMKNGKYEQSIDILLKSNTEIDLNDSSTLDLIRKFRKMNQFSGKYIQYKILKQKKIENDIAIYSCLVKYEIKFYRFVFIFYRPTDKATIYKFIFDDSVDIELEESLKMYLN